MSWLVDTLVVYGGLARWLSFFLTLGLALYLGAYTLVFALLGRRLWSGPWWGALLGWPSLWVVMEWIRGLALSGFPWNLAGYALLDTPGALPAAALMGATGLSFVLVWTASGLALGLVRRRSLPVLLGALLPLVLFSVGLVSAEAEKSQEPGLPVRVIQPNLSILESWDDEVILGRYQKLMDLSRSACDQEGALVLWPESAPWPFVFGRDAALRRDLDRLAGQGCGFLFNSAHGEDGRIYNSAYLLGSQGVLGRYDKRHLVPFGEYVPLQSVFPFIQRLARAAGDLTAAEELRLLPWQGQNLGVAVCYEVVFPLEVGDLVDKGATVLVTLTNDAWYGNTAAPWQHYRAARFRAAELRRPMVRAALTGVSGIFSGKGSVLGQLGVGEEGILAAEIRPGRDRTLYALLGPYLPYSCVLLSLSTVFIAISWRRKRREGERYG
jgi:apolipoprotein N-acyltransferase